MHRPVAIAGILSVVGLVLLVLLPGSAPVRLGGRVAGREVIDLTDQGTDVNILLTVDDVGFHPAFVKVAPGASVSILVRNAARDERNLSIENDLVSFDEHVRPGESATTPYAFEMPDDAAVRFFDHDLLEDGFQGAIFTREGQGLLPGEELLDPSH